MFTGLIDSLATVAEISDRQITLNTPPLGTALGDSVAVNGVCLTVAQFTDRGFIADVSPETWQRSNLGSLYPGSWVNIELALAVGDRLGGHFVAGHVDGVGTLRSRQEQGTAWWLDFAIPPELDRYLVDKGSIAVNGISLTIASCRDGFQVAVIPHTYAQTNLQHLLPGAAVNLEVDMLAKYVEKLVQSGPQTSNLITPEFLREHGYQ